MDNFIDIASVPIIGAVTYWVLNIIRVSTNNNETFKRHIPLLSAIIGVTCGVVAFYTIPGIIPAGNVVVAILIGGASGLSATGASQVIKQLSRFEQDRQKALLIEIELDKGKEIENDKSVNEDKKEENLEKDKAKE